MTADPELPRDLPILERSAVRVVVLDADGLMLLLHTHDVDHPDLGQWWELPGGGIDLGESYLDAALRELQEEAGLLADPAQVGRPTWRRRASFRHRQVRHLQDEVVVVVRLNTRRPRIEEAGRLDYEKLDYFGFRWWAPADVQNSKDHFYPGRLPELIGPFLDGVEIDEPFELFS